MDGPDARNYFINMSVSAATAEQFVDVPGGSVYVRIWTPARPLSRVPLVLLHDSLGCVETWRDFPSLLSARLGRPVIAYDRLGFGRSSARSDLPSIRFISEEAEICFPAIRQSLGLGRFVVMGHSVGGSMAVVCAGCLARDCDAVVTESAQAFVEDRTRQGIIEAKASFRDPGELGKLAKYHGDKTSWVLRAWTDVWLSSEFASWSLKDELPRVQCPLLAVHGERDEFGSSRFPEMLCSLAGGPAEKLIIPGCGHVPHREKPDVVLEALARFLSNR